MTLVSEDKPKGIARVGNKGTLISLRQAQPAGTVDHFALSIDGFNKDAVPKRSSSMDSLLEKTPTPDST